MYIYIYSIIPILFPHLETIWTAIAVYINLHTHVSCVHHSMYILICRVYYDYLYVLFMNS